MNSTLIKPVVVIGDGWAALAAVGLLATEPSVGGDPTQIRWIASSGAKILSPLPTLEAGQGLGAAPLLRELARRLGIDSGPDETGSYLREYRNKAFREPAWLHAPTPEARAEVLNELLWAPERTFVNLFETRFTRTLGELEEDIRSRLTGNLFANVRRTEGVLVSAFETVEGQVRAVILSSGERIEASRVIFADTWDQLAGMSGLPKPLTFTRKREAVGILQATLTHEQPIGAGVEEGFFASMHKDAGEEIQRHVWGYFSSDGKRSFWSVCLSTDEVENNHEIAKKLRKMKTTLDRIFVGSPWVADGKPDFLSNVSAVGGEQVRFEDAFVFSEGDVIREPVTLPGYEGLQFLTDGYGPSSSFEQVRALMGWSSSVGLTTEKPHPQTEDMDLGGTVSS